MEKNKDLNTPRIELIRDVKVSYPGEEHAITNQSLFLPIKDDTLTDGSAICCLQRKVIKHS